MMVTIKTEVLGVPDIRAESGVVLSSLDWGAFHQEVKGQV